MAWAKAACGMWGSLLSFWHGDSHSPGSGPGHNGNCQGAFPTETEGRELFQHKAFQLIEERLKPSWHFHGIDESLGLSGNKEVKLDVHPHGKH